MFLYLVRRTGRTVKAAAASSSDCSTASKWRASWSDSSREDMAKAEMRASFEIVYGSEVLQPREEFKKEGRMRKWGEGRSVTTRDNWSLGRGRWADRFVATPVWTWLLVVSGHLMR